jgi:hypothetical protein
MSKFDKLLTSILSGLSDKNIRFEELCLVLERLGFQKRVKGDHFIFAKDGVVEILNLQPVGKNAKAYQVKQVRNLIVKYRLGVKD